MERGVRLRRNRWHRYTIEAWRDEVASWSDRLNRKARAGLAVEIELAEGRQLLDVVAVARGSPGPRPTHRPSARPASAWPQRPMAGPQRGLPVSAPSSPPVPGTRPHRGDAYDPELCSSSTARPRPAARGTSCSRSQGREAGRATTLVEAEWRLPQLKRLGYDVVYLPPIHPIGTTNRKGRNNAEQAEPGDIGSPWAIGSADGGHEAVAPELGGLEGFQHFRQTAERLGLEVALDLAIQASPDHPWVRDHPEWFRHAPDGSIRYAENPPKRYQDVYPFDFRGPDHRARVALWEAWRELVLTWVERGVRIFRVDNPHTKPVAFWAWLIREVQARYPDVIFLAETFTRHKPMRLYSKAGTTSPTPTSPGGPMRRRCASTSSS